MFKVQTVGDAYVVVAGLPHRDVCCFNCPNTSPTSPFVPVRTSTVCERVGCGWVRGGVWLGQGGGEWKGVVECVVK